MTSTSRSSAARRRSEAAPSFLESLLRRDRALLVAGLGAVLVLAWGWLLLGAGTGMTALEMTAMAGMDGWLMQPAIWTPGYALLMFSMWWIMMAAMMAPSAAPMLLLFARVNRKQAAGRPLTPAGLFALGYLLAWGGFSAVAVSAQWAMEAVRAMSPMMQTTNVWLGAGILIAAGLWQLTPVKTICLRQCRSPLGFLIGSWRAGGWGALRMGLEHGAFCLGCCWILMALLFFGGVMNLYWIVGLTGFVVLEKLAPLGHWIGRAAGVGLVAWGSSLAVGAL